ncbi:VanZ family protein [Sulfuricaulis sp.]|uniref:VanZ family protein n=1 Tax=Sulfuricaulis sp. TaxID=2003553 RepID=UPI003559DDC9
MSLKVLQRSRTMSHSSGYCLLAGSWMLLIFFLSSQSSLPAVSFFSGADLLLHAVFYAILCVFLARSFMDPQIRNWNRVILLTVLVTAYGITDKYHQFFVPERSASIWDVLADFWRPPCFSGGIARRLIFQNTTSRMNQDACSTLWPSR